MTVQPNEADLYGYTNENINAYAAFSDGRSTLQDWEYGLEIVRLTMAAYLSAEKGKTIDMTDPDKAVPDELESYVPKIQRGHGGEVF